MNLNIAALQMDLAWHQPAVNKKKVERWLDDYRGELDLVLLPEMFTTGFSMEAAQLAEPSDGPTRQWLRHIAKQRNILIGGSIITEEGGKFFNRFWLTGPQGWEEKYDKRHTFRMAREHEHYQAGGERVVVEFQGWRMLLLVCYDLRFPVWSRNFVDSEGKMDYDLILCVANWPHARVDQWETLLKARAIENQCYLAAVNRVGADGNGIAYSGRSMIVDPLGSPLVEAAKHETLLLARIEKERLESYRKKFPVWMDADAFTLNLET